MSCFLILNATKDQILSRHKLNALVRWPLSLGKYNIIIVACKEINQTYAYINHAYFDMNSIRIYHKHLIQLYENYEEFSTTIPVHKIVSHDVMVREAAKRLSQLPDPMPVYRLNTTPIAITLTDNYVMNVHDVKNPDDGIAAITMAILLATYLVKGHKDKTTTTVDGKVRVGFCNLSGLNLHNYT